MNERWVCKRCFADNDETTSTCQRCGLLRGAESTEADRKGWAAPAGSTAAGRSEPRGWQRWIGFWWVPVLVIVLGRATCSAPVAGTTAR